MRPTARAVFTTMLAVWSTTAHGATATLNPVADASIFENNPDNGSGGGNGLFVGTNAAGFVRRALLQFDLDDAIPQGAVIENVMLTATLGDYSRSTTLPSVLVGLHRASASWGEAMTQAQVPPSDVLAMMGQGLPALAGDVTWSSRFHDSTPATPWTTPGGDFAVSSSADAAVGTTVGTEIAWSSPSMIDDAQVWFDDPASNYGWLLQNASEETGSSLRVFFTGDAATPSNWPRLEVTFRMPGDFNGDDRVDGGDLAEWRGHFGAVGDRTADADRDDDVDGADFLVWQRHVGPATAAAVPEPDAWRLLGGAAISLAATRMRLCRAAAGQRLVNPPSGRFGWAATAAPLRSPAGIASGTRLPASPRSTTSTR